MTIDNRSSKFQASLIRAPLSSIGYSPSPTRPPHPQQSHRLISPYPHSQPIDLPSIIRINFRRVQRIVPLVAAEATRISRALIPDGIWLRRVLARDVLSRRVPAVAPRVICVYTAPVRPADEPPEPRASRAPVVLASLVTARPRRLANYAGVAGVLLIAVWTSVMVLGLASSLGI